MSRRVPPWVTSIWYTSSQNQYNSTGESPLYVNSSFFILCWMQLLYDGSFIKAQFSSTNQVTGFKDKVQTRSLWTSVSSVSIYHCWDLSAKVVISRRGLQIRRGCWINPWLVPYWWWWAGIFRPQLFHASLPCSPDSRVWQCHVEVSEPARGEKNVAEQSGLLLLLWSHSSRQKQLSKKYFSWCNLS